MFADDACLKKFCRNNLGGRIIFAFGFHCKRIVAMDALREFFADTIAVFDSILT
jgi:hypothetical protein